MKKSLIAASVASLAVAAMPVVGVFAAGEATVTDTLTVNIPPSCTVTNSVNSQAPENGNPQAIANHYTVNMKNGQLKSDIGGTTGGDGGSAVDSTINVSCNTPANDDTNNSTWRLTAIGAGTEGFEDKLHGTAGDIATGTGTSGDSQWAFKVTKGGDNVNWPTGDGAYAGGFAEVPSEDDGEMDIVTGRGNATGAFTMTYQVYINQTQATGSYTGAVKYTLYNPAN